MSLRERASRDLKRLNLRDWPMPVKLTDPSGVTYVTDAETGGTLEAVQILYDSKRIEPDTGEEIIVNDPIVCMHKLSLARIPKAGERWHIRIPKSPTNQAVFSDFFLSEDRAPEEIGSLDVIRLYLQKAEQSA